MGNHQRHSRHGGNNNWQDESRDEQGRFRSDNEGTSDADWERDRDNEYGRGGMRGGYDRGLEMNHNDRDRGDYEADYGFPQGGDRGSRWNESGRAGEYRRDTQSRDRNDRAGRGDRAGFDGRDRQRDYGRNVSSSYGMGSPFGYDADNYRGSDRGSRWSSQGDASQGFESRHRGEHAGKGPKGYKRSDERIEEDVNEALARDPSLDASEIEVKVKDGEVTLSGTVPDRRMKRRAEDCAEDCSGVRDVQNHLRLEKSAGEQGSGADTSHQGKSGSKHSGNGAAAGSGANSTSGSTSKHQSSSSTQ